MTATCTVYKKIYSSVVDSPYAHQIADSMCKQAHNMKLNDNGLSAEEILNVIRIHQDSPHLPTKNIVSAVVKLRNADAVTDKSYPRSDEPGNPGMKDKKYDLSVYPDKASCIQGLVSDQNLSLAVATSECESQFGPGEGTVSGKARKAILSRITRQYPNLSRQSAEAIVNEAIRGSLVKAHISKAKKTVSSMTANSRHVYAATVADEIPAYLTINAFNEGHYYPDSSTTSNIRSASDEQGAKNWLTIQMHQDGKKFEDQTSSKIKSASVKDNAWLFTDRKLVNRNAFEYQRQEAEKKSNIRNASTTTDNRPAWLQIMDYYAKGSPN